MKKKQNKVQIKENKDSEDQLQKEQEKVKDLEQNKERQKNVLIKHSAKFRQ